MRNEKFVCIVLFISFLGCENEIVNPVPSIPIVKILSPTMNSIVTQTTDIVVEASDDQKIIRVEVLIDGNLYFTTDSSSTQYSFGWYPIGHDGKQYIIEAVAYDNDGNKATSKAVIVKFFYFTPFLNSVSIINDSLFKLEWYDNSKIETGFEIEKAVNDSNFTLIATADSNVTEIYVKDSIDLNATYYFRMRAINQTQKSAYSVIRSAKVFLTAPTIVNAILSGDTLVTISWADTNSFKDNYRVTIGNLVKIIPKDSNTTQISFNFAREVNHYIYVSVIQGLQYGPPKSIVIRFEFNAPANLRSESDFIDKVVLKWTDNTTAEAGFIIFRGLVTGSLLEYARVGANFTEFTDTELDTNVTYLYNVKAFTNINQSLASNNLTVGFTQGIVQENVYVFQTNFREGVFSENFQYFFKNKNRSAAMYSVPNMIYIRDLETPPDTQYGPYPEIVASYDGSRVSRGFDISYSGSGSGSRAAVWNTTTGVLQDYFNTSCLPEPLAFAKDNSKLLVMNCSKVMSYSIPGGTFPQSIISSYVRARAYAKYDLIAFGIQGSIKIFGISDGILKKTITSPYYETPLGFSPDANYLISSSGNSVDVYDINLATKVFSLPLYNMKRGFMTNDNKTLILIGASDVSLYDISTKKLVQKKNLSGQIYHSGYFEEPNKLAVALQTNLTYYKFIKSWKMLQ